MSADELPSVSNAARGVIEEAKAAGIYGFAGGIHEGIDAVPVDADGGVSSAIYPGSRLKGGYTIAELPTREAAIEWARKIAVGCRCSQAFREFIYDPAS